MHRELESRAEDINERMASSPVDVLLVEDGEKSGEEELDRKAEDIDEQVWSSPGDVLLGE